MAMEDPQAPEARVRRTAFWLLAGVETKRARDETFVAGLRQCHLSRQIT
jgi:hypothetical protein